MTCPRPHCGGLILRRHVLTVEGRVMQDVCVACGRLVGFMPAKDPYRAYRVSFSVEVERALVERIDPVVPPGDAHNDDNDPLPGRLGV